MNRMQLYILFVTLVLLGSCSGDQESAEDTTQIDHVWKDQVQAYDNARQVEEMLDQAAKRSKQNLEQQTQ